MLWVVGKSVVVLGASPAQVFRTVELSLMRLGGRNENKKCENQKF